MLFYTLVTITTIYTVVAFSLLVTHSYLKRKYGIQGSTEMINQLARTRTVVVFEICSWASLLAWFGLFLPWADLFTFQYAARFTGGGVETYFGWMGDRHAEIYFFTVLLSIPGAKAAIIGTELARMLRKGRVIVIPYGWLQIFRPATHQ